jgi:hypothetical protein
VTVEDAASISELAAIDAAIATMSVTAVADTAANLATNSGGYVTGSVNVTITGSVTASQLKTINDLTSGSITLNVTNDTLLGSASDLAAAFDGSITTHTGTIIVQTDPTVTELKTINDNSSGSINLGGDSGSSVSLSGSSSDVVDAVAGFTSLEGTINLTTSASTSQLTSIDTATSGVITVATTTVGANAGYDLTTDLAADGSTDLTNFTGLTTIDASEAGNAAMTITAADIFAANDATGDIETFNVTGTNGGGDTLDLSTGSESWSTDNGGATYTATGNFDGIAGEETYTITITDISSVTI